MELEIPTTILPLSLTAVAAAVVCPGRGPIGCMVGWPVALGMTHRKAVDDVDVPTCPTTTVPSAETAVACEGAVPGMRSVNEPPVHPECPFPLKRPGRKFRFTDDHIAIAAHAVSARRAGCTRQRVEILHAIGLCPAECMLGRAGDDLRVPYHDGTVLVRVGPERRAAAVVRRIECAEVQGSALQEPAKRMVGRTRPIILIADHARPSTIEIGSTALDIGGFAG